MSILKTLIVIKSYLFSFSSLKCLNINTIRLKIIFFRLNNKISFSYLTFKRVFYSYAFLTKEKLLYKIYSFKYNFISFKIRVYIASMMEKKKN